MWKYNKMTLAATFRAFKTSCEARRKPDFELFKFCRLLDEATSTDFVYLL